MSSAFLIVDVQNDFVTGGGLAGGAVGDRASNVLRRCGSAQQRKADENNCYRGVGGAKLHARPPLATDLRNGVFSMASISAKIAAASSSSDARCMA